ncbi:hypothetical protein [Streptomyces flavidovirens]|uniref:hypothetical protein n=1 Tax=Streptomyces flavidovirens TaxID=67298 RepID=UPI0036832E52
MLAELIGTDVLDGRQLRGSTADHLLHGCSDARRLAERAGCFVLLLSHVHAVTTENSRLICIAPGDESDVVSFFASQGVW